MSAPILSVNINKFATIRNARGGNNPNLIQVAKDCESFGAQGITVHPQDQMSGIFRYADTRALALPDVINTEFNIEGNPNASLYRPWCCRAKPTQVTLVPDGPETY